jgi:hypothetical protein
MSTHSIPQVTSRGYTDRPETKPPHWEWLVVWDIFCNNLSTGLFLVAALGELTAPHLFTQLANIAYPIALGLLLLDLSLLVLDLGDPWRFHHMLRVFKPSSPMSLGTWSLTIYSLPLTVIVATELLPEEWGWPAWVRKTAIVLALVPALASAVYKGVLLSTSAQPGWRDARWLGGYLTSSALALGCLGMLALAVVLEADEATAVLRSALVALLLLHLVPLALLLGNIWSTLLKIYTPPQLRLLAVLSLGGCMALPLCLLLATDNPLLTLGAALFLLLGSLAIRFVIIRVPRALDEPRTAA